MNVNTELLSVYWEYLDKHKQKLIDITGEQLKIIAADGEIDREDFSACFAGYTSHMDVAFVLMPLLTQKQYGLRNVIGIDHLLRFVESLAKGSAVIDGKLQKAILLRLSKELQNQSDD